MTENTEIFKQLFQNSELSLDSLKNVTFPLFVKSKAGNYIYFNSALLTKENINLKKFLTSKETELSRNTLQWMTNDLHLFESRGFIEREFSLDDKTYKVYKFYFTSYEEEFIVGFAVNTTSLSDSESRRHILEKTLRSIPDSIVVCENDGEKDFPIIYCNKGFTQLTGYTEKEILGKNCRFLQGEKTDKEVLSVIKECILSGREYEGVIKNYKKDGTPFWNRLNLKPIYDPNSHKLSHFVGIQREVGSIEESDFPTNYIDDLPAVIFSISATGLILDVNKFAQRYLGYKEIDLIDKPLDSFMKEDSRLVFNSKLLPDLVLTGSVLNEVLILKNKEGEDVKFIVSARNKKDAYIVVLTELVNLTRPDKFISPEGGPWYLHWGAALYNYVFNSRSRAAKIIGIFLFSLMPITGLFYYEYEWADKHGSLLPYKEEVVKAETGNDILWATQALSDPYRFTQDRREEVYTELLTLRAEFSAIRVSMRVYGQDNLAYLLLDLFKTGPGRGSIPRDLWIVEVSDPGYSNLQEAFKAGNCYKRVIKSKENPTEFSEAAEALSVDTIVSCADRYNSFFYTSLDFDRELTEDEEKAVNTRLKAVNNRLLEILHY